MVSMRINYKSPHLIATGIAFWLGVFSKIQSIFTISLSFNSRENNQNLRRDLKNVYPSTYVKVGF